MINTKTRGGTMSNRNRSSDLSDHPPPQARSPISSPNSPTPPPSPPPDLQDEDGDTALMKAVKGGHSEIANELKTRNSDETIPNKDGDHLHQLTLNTNLLSASTAGDVAIVTSLLQQGASVVSEDDYGDTGLHQSAMHGHDDILKIFLNDGVDVNIRGSGQWTSLMYAAYKGHLSITRILLDNGEDTDIELSNSDGDTALMIAAGEGYADIVSELLARGAQEDVTNKKGETAIKQAENFGRFDVLSLFAACHNPESRDERLFQACDEGKTRLVRALLIAGVSFEYRNAVGDQAIHKAARNGHVHTVRVLHEAGADINSIGKDGLTPLHKAAYNRQLNTARYLLNSGAKINMCDDDGRTALQYVTYVNHLGLVCELLDWNADKSIKNKYGNTALDRARALNYKDIALVLDDNKITENDANTTKVLMAVTQKGNVKVLADLLKRGASIDIKSPVGETPFQLATRFPQIKKQEYDLEMKAYQKTGYKPVEPVELIIQKANEKSNEMAKMFLSQKLSKHDQESIIQRIADISNHCKLKSNQFDVSILEKNKFYLNYSSSKENEETLLESCVSHGLILEREEILGIMKMIEEDSNKGKYWFKEEVKSAIPSSVGLRDCLKSVSNRYPYGWMKMSSKIGLTAIVLTISLGFYVFDVYTDIQFTKDMVDDYSRSFTDEKIEECKDKENFDQEFDQAIQDCRTNFTSSLCMDQLSLLKKIGQNCFQNEERFKKEPDEWITLGVVSGVHVGLSVVTALIIWAAVEFGREYESCFIVNLPIPLITKIHKFICDISLYKNEHKRKEIQEQEYQAQKKKIVDKISAYENVVNLSLIIEASVESSFQFFLQTTFLLPSVVLFFIDPSGGADWSDLVNWRFVSIGMSFASFSFGFYKIR